MSSVPRMGLLAFNHLRQRGKLASLQEKIEHRRIDLSVRVGITDDLRRTVARLLLRAREGVMQVVPVLISQNVFINQFEKVNPPPESSTYRSLSLIKTLS